MFWAVHVLMVLLSLMAVPSLSQTKDGCQEKCGNVSIPYPFGLGDNPYCFQATKFQLFCNTTHDPPKLFIRGDYSRPIIDISLDGQMKITFWIAVECYDKDGIRAFRRTVTGRQPGYIYSSTRNKFVAIGCDTQAFISDSEGRRFQSGCSSFCWDRTSVSGGTCSGIGCCEAAIPKDVTSLNLTVSSFRTDQNQSRNSTTCSYAFLADKEWYNFSALDLIQFNFPRRIEYSFQNWPSTPVWLDWAIGDANCTVAQNSGASYACGFNTKCSTSPNDSGYLCHCNEGFQGNPYLQDGCQDIDECKDNSLNRCERICANTQGNYTCSCPPGHHGDGIKGGSGCTKNTTFPVIQLVLGIGLGFLFILLGTTWICWSLEKRKLSKLKEKFFHQNGGMLLQQKLLSHTASVETTKVFTSEELKVATNNYHESRILGRGGYGTVYKAILPDERIVAIKKSKVVDKEQIEQFINEVLILSQINHRNVVKLLGCCLETEVPLLVYEFINNGTLFHHIHDPELKYSISFANRLRIASETAGALAYLHSSASQPVIHRDVKSANILLDESYTAKVADFGASRLIALDQTELSTLVQGTMGYLDPEYLLTSLLTDKSDVYSFGVVLVELLTGRKALCFEKPEEERNLAMFFVSSLKTNRLFEVLDRQVVSEASSEQLQEVANLARRCLRLSSEERPTMKEVAMELEGIRISLKQTWIAEDPEESTYLINESDGCHDSSSGYNVIRDRVMDLLYKGR